MKAYVTPEMIEVLMNEQDLITTSLNQVEGEDCDFVDWNEIF